MLFHNIQGRLAFELIYRISKFEYSRFKKALGNVEKSQRKKLARLLELSGNTEYGKKKHLHQNLSYKEFTKRIPITNFSDWEPLIEEQCKNSRSIISPEICKRYQPTSGFGLQTKWFPYTGKFLSELERAISPMIMDYMISDSTLFKGSHYWALSWIPKNLRSKINPNINADTSLMPWWKRWLAQHTVAVPEAVSFAETPEGTTIATLAYLLSTRDLVLFSVWSSFFALNLFNGIKHFQNDLILILEKGSWGIFQKELSFLPCPKSQTASDILKNWDGILCSDFFKILWPKMSLISCWDTSWTHTWVEDLTSLFPDVRFLGKGYIATEGIITIPFECKFPLALTSHFYEFQDLETGRIHPAWDIEEGQIMKPIISTGAGIFRYVLEDRIKVVDFLNDCPCLSFLGRIHEITLAGEKTNTNTAEQIINKVNYVFKIRAISLLAFTCKNKNSKPYYSLLCANEKNEQQENEVAKFIEQMLCNSLSYQKAIKIGKLSPAKVIFNPQAISIYNKNRKSHGIFLGDMKIEPLEIRDDDNLF